jgi:hypothetical protein
VQGLNVDELMELVGGPAGCTARKWAGRVRGVRIGGGVWWLQKDDSCGIDWTSFGGGYYDIEGLTRKATDQGGLQMNNWQELLLCVMGCLITGSTLGDQQGAPSLDDLERQLQTKRPAQNREASGPLGVLSATTYLSHLEETVGNGQKSCTWIAITDRRLQFSHSNGSKLEGVISVTKSYNLTLTNRSDCNSGYAGNYTISIVFMRDGSFHSALTDRRCLFGNCGNEFPGARGEAAEGKYEILQDSAKLILRYSPASGGDALVYGRG